MTTAVRLSDVGRQIDTILELEWEDFGLPRRDRNAANATAQVLAGTGPRGLEWVYRVVSRGDRWQVQRTPR